MSILLQGVSFRGFEPREMVSRQGTGSQDEMCCIPPYKEVKNIVCRDAPLTCPPRCRTASTPCQEGEASLSASVLQRLSSPSGGISPGRLCETATTVRSGRELSGVIRVPAV